MFNDASTNTFSSMELVGQELATLGAAAQAQQGITIADTKFTQQ